MKKTFTLLVAAGLAVSACGKHDAGDNTATTNSDVIVNDEAGSELGNSDGLANAALPLDENAALPADNGASGNAE